MGFRHSGSPTSSVSDGDVTRTVGISSGTITVEIEVENTIVDAIDDRDIFEGVLTREVALALEEAMVLYIAYKF